MDALPQDASRSAYTQRILEIVSNIKKQKEEITKVSQTGEGWVEAGLDGCAQTTILLQILTDTKHLQKEINALTGKLDRTFAVTDEMVFKVTKRFWFWLWFSRTADQSWFVLLWVPGRQER